MATGVLAGGKFSALVGLQSIPIGHDKEGSTQSFKAGELLIYSSGTLVVSTADPVSIVVGMALCNASGVAGTDIPYIQLMEGVEFEFSLMGSAAANYTLAATDMGVAYGVAVSANKWYLDQSETTAVLFRIVRPADPWIVGDINARVIVRPITARYLP